MIMLILYSIGRVTKSAITVSWQIRQVTEAKGKDET